MKLKKFVTRHLIWLIPAEAHWNEMKVGSDFYNIVTLCNCYNWSSMISILKQNENENNMKWKGKESMLVSSFLLHGTEVIGTCRMFMVQLLSLKRLSWTLQIAIEIKRNVYGASYFHLFMKVCSLRWTASMILLWFWLRG